MACARGQSRDIIVKEMSGIRPLTSSRAKGIHFFCRVQEIYLINERKCKLCRLSETGPSQRFLISFF